MGRAAKRMTHTVTIAATASLNNYGDITTGAQSTIAARVEHKFTKVIDVNGEEKRAGHTVTSEDEIKLSDFVWLPGDDITKEGRRAIATKATDSPLDGYTLYRAWF